MALKRNSQGHYAGKRSWKFIASVWAGCVLSLGLLYVTANAVMSNFASFRSCNANNNGIHVVNCGKGSLNLGDVVMLGLFILSACLAVATFTAAWRFSRRGKL